MPATIEEQVKPHFKFWREWRADRNNAQKEVDMVQCRVNVEVVVHHPPAELQHASPGVCFRFIDGVQEAVPLLVHRLVEPVEPSLDIAINNDALAVHSQCSSQCSALLRHPGGRSCHTREA